MEPHMVGGTGNWSPLLPNHAVVLFCCKCVGCRDSVEVDRVSGVCLLFSPNQYHRNIIHIGTGSACDDQSLHGLQGVVGIVVFQGVEHLPARRSQCSGGVAVRIATGSTLPSLG